MPHRAQSQSRGTLLDVRRIEIELELRLGRHKFTFLRSFVLSFLGFLVVLVGDQWVVRRGSQFLYVGHAKFLFLEDASRVPSERMHAIRVIHLTIAFPAA